MAKDKMWDFFIAHSAYDIRYAEMLYNYLSTDFKVFLDKKCLKLGDDWDRALPLAQKNSFITLVLVSNNTDSAYYEREEIATAIYYSRKEPNNYKTIPIFLESIEAYDMPYGLFIKQGIYVTKKMGLKDISRKLKEEYQFSMREIETQLDDKVDINNADSRELFNKKQITDRPMQKRIKKTKNAQFKYFENQKKLIKCIEADVCNTDSVIWIDLDGFTTINKKYGKEIADSIIYNIISIIEFSVKDDACVLYHANKRDDFLIIANNVISSVVGSSILSDISLFEWDKLIYGLFVHSSIGIGKRCKKEKPLDVIKKARLGLNEAKKNGGHALYVQEVRISPRIDVNLFDS